MLFRSFSDRNYREVITPLYGLDFNMKTEKYFGTRRKTRSKPSFWMWTIIINHEKVYLIFWIHEYFVKKQIRVFFEILGNNLAIIEFFEP